MAGPRRTNVEALIGLKGVVIDEVAPLKYGRVKVRGEDWAAIPAAEVSIPAGAVVIVQGYEGVKLIVAEVDSNNA
ncbi:MAG: NfeD family protein [Candidatus Coatesbacteria bacterium]|nr:MAG: NfeD family protein [Candidatus Coatesbacteria bacterium]